MFSFFAFTNDSEAALTGAFLQDTTNTADLTTYTFASQNLGTADTDRCIIVIAISRKAGAAHTLSSASIGGVSATIIQNQNNQVTNSDTAAMFSAIVPTGTTGDIVVTWSTTVLRTAIMAYRVVGVDSCTTPYASAASTASDPSVSLDVPAGGFAVGGGLSAAATTATWTGLTENADATLESFVTYSSASANFASESLSTTMTLDFVSSTETAGVFASWGEPSAPVVTDSAQLFINYGKFKIDNGKIIVD